MEIRKLRSMAGGESAGVTLPKAELREDGLVDETGTVLDGHFAKVERVAEGAYRVELVGK